MNFAELEQLWVAQCSANGQPQLADLAPVMAAIALAESAGNPSAVGDTSTPYPSYGLWQIRSVHADTIPNFFPQQGSSEWSDPAQNASAAIAVLNSPGGLANWSTYSSGAYKQYLSGSSSAASGASGGASGSWSPAAAAPTPQNLILVVVGIAALAVLVSLFA